jgi:DNA repair ATPase RecN
MVPLIQQLKPEEWVAKGAPETYADQWKSVQAEVGYLENTAERLAAEPERLTLALEALFRMQSIDARLASLFEAVRKYQNPALAELLESLAAGNGPVRIALQQHVAEVAAQREAEWRIMEAEAQRCRTQLTAPAKPAARPAPPKKQ